MLTQYYIQKRDVYNGGIHTKMSMHARLVSMQSQSFM